MRPKWLMAVVLLGACGTNAVVTPPPGQTTAAPSTTLLVQPPTTIPVSSTVEVLTALPYQWPDDLTEVVRFWEPLWMTGADQFIRFRTLKDLADSATVVVVVVALGPDHQRRSVVIPTTTRSPHHAP